MISLHSLKTKSFYFILIILLIQTNGYAEKRFYFFWEQSANQLFNKGDNKLAMIQVQKVLGLDPSNLRIETSLFDAEESKNYKKALDLSIKLVLLDNKMQIIGMQQAGFIC